MTRIGLYGVSTQSGHAFLADCLLMGVPVYGYARPSQHGMEAVDTLVQQGGITLRRPEEGTHETSRFLPLGDAEVGHDLERLIHQSDVIILAHPAQYQEESARRLKEAGLLQAPDALLVLSPSRTLATPYLWRILVEGYPVVSFQTCPYSCKSASPGSTYIKRRKKSWIASVEGHVPGKALAALKDVFPQFLTSRIPATTSLGNIGAVFHPTTYLLNWDAILAAEARGTTFPFYLEGIARNQKAAKVIEDVDQIRLRIAHALGISVFGLEGDPREEEWAAIMERVPQTPAPAVDIQDARRLRARYLQPIHDSVVSAQHWLDYTYGVTRIPGEPLADAIARTPTYQRRSYPQARYIHEDVPTGLVPLESLAERLGIPHEPITHIVDLYQDVTGKDARRTGRNLDPFDTAYLRQYLLGRLGA
ncbi:MAG: NAD/NADP octopine/nopaline dehydrogenase family protein [Chloroflexota bacterium]|nr:NAD/NADP octopine/nopaline dehydrogenase family protein [Chloroflexota bacterium]